MKLAPPVWLTEPAQSQKTVVTKNTKNNRSHHTCVRTIIYQHNEHVGFKRLFNFFFPSMLYILMYENE